MNQKRKKKGSLLAVMTLAFLLGGLLREDAAMTVRAESEGAFSIQAEMVPSDKEAYSVRVTIENQGEDWEGTVRLVVDEDYRTPCAYDTTLSLPQGSRKQFVVRIPMSSIDRTSGTVTIHLLDRREKTIAEKEFKRLLAGQMDALSMGILSDAYSKLTYMDMGGLELYFYNDLYPIRLVDLQQGSLEDELDALTFLVIDQYNTSILTEEELEAIELWNYDGGVLILGTGAYAEDTLSGFDSDYLGISSKTIHEPGDDYLFESSYAGNIYMEMSQLSLAELQGTSDAYASSYIDYYYGGWLKPMVNGSAAILSYSLTELGGLDDDYWYIEPERFIEGLLENVSSNANSRYSSSTSYYSDYSSDIRRLLSAMGNANSVLNFGGLKVIVVLYVIFVGPVLYLILRLLKRRELYWVAVPVTALLGIVLVFFAGRGFEVVSTKAYSVTMKNLSEGQKSVTYLYCYDADRSEWDLKMADGCEYAGPLSSTSYYSSYADSYYYHIQKEGDAISVGINPEANFEDSYFYLGSTGNDSGVEGDLLAEDIWVNLGGVNGTVANHTNKDISYLAVIWHDSIYVYEGLTSGASYRLEDLIPLYDRSGSYYGSYIYSFLSDYYDHKEYSEASALAALGVGIYHLLPQADSSEFIVVGVVEDWDKTVDDNCSEISYGCLYSLQ